MAHLDLSRDFLLDFGRKHALHRILHLLDSIVDDAVEADIDVHLLCQLAGWSGRTNLEADDEAVLGSGCHVDIALADLTHSLVDDVDLNLLGREFDERVAECLDGAVHVALDDEVEFLHATQSDVVSQLFQTTTLHGAQTLFASQLLTLVGNLASLLVAVHHMEGIACLRCAVQAKYCGGLRRTNLLHALSTFVEHGLHATVVRAGQQDVADMECAVADEHGSHIATTLV